MFILVLKEMEIQSSSRLQREKGFFVGSLEH